ncbi:alpha/beta fold hydrolase [Roseobacteraceae bacterium NS-SX3]
MSVWNIFALAAVGAPAALLGAGHLKTRRLARQAEALVPQAGEQQPVSGGAIHFVERGAADAPPLVLIHGLSGQLQHFTYAMADLLAPKFRVIALDRPGCGYSTRAGAHLATLPEQAAMILDFLDRRGISRPLVAGHSLGGAVALAMALQAPEGLRGLALLAPLTHPAEGGAEAFKGLIVHSPLLRQLLAHTLAVPAAERAAQEVLAQIFAPDACPADFLQRGGGALGLRPQGFLAASEDASHLYPAITEQAARYAAGLKTPGAVLFGSADAVLDPEAQGRAMERFGLSCQIAPGLGHMLPIVAPGLCAGFIRDTAAALPG